MRIAFYISGHGFGHASRAIELILALMARRPAMRVVVRTAAPERLFSPLAGFGEVGLEHIEADSGMAQIDSLAARGERLALHRDGRGAPPARRDDR